MSANDLIKELCTARAARQKAAATAAASEVRAGEGHDVDAPKRAAKKARSAGGSGPQYASWGGGAAHGGGGGGGSEADKAMVAALTAAYNAKVASSAKTLDGEDLDKALENHLSWYQARIAARPKQ